MIRLILEAVAILHLGPGIAFALLAFGCDGDLAFLRDSCAGSGLSAFFSLTAWAWLALLLGWGAMLLLRRRREPAEDAPAAE